MKTEKTINPQSTDKALSKISELSKFALEEQRLAHEEIITCISDLQETTRDILKRLTAAEFKANICYELLTEDQIKTARKLFQERMAQEHQP